jgi:2-oxoglutarate ferredoxin oxidoreductase subunit alpha
MMDKRMSRLDLILKNIPEEEKVLSFGTAEHTIISWGSTKGPILDAIDMLKKEGITIGFIQLKLLHPFPTDYVKSLLKDTKTIIDIEANHSGQLGKLFNQNIQRDIDYFILKYTGRAITSTEIYDALKKIIENKADKREVLTHGA